MESGLLAHSDTHYVRVQNNLFHFVCISCNEEIESMLKIIIKI